MRAEPDPTQPDGVGLGDVGESAPERWIMGGPNNPRGPPRALAVRAGRGLPRAGQRAAARRRSRPIGSPSTPTTTPRRCPPPTARSASTSATATASRSPRSPASRPARRTCSPRCRPATCCSAATTRTRSAATTPAACPGALVDNATYGAFRILYQDVAGFEQLLRDWGQAASADPEVIAAKLMGRWRNGAPLVLAPDLSNPNPSLPEDALNAFDYAPGEDHPAFYDDARGLRCPVGAHVRRLNPRGSRVMGKSYSRRLVRRNMPYGPELPPGEPDDGVDRGLVGYFLCGDLETQWEFIQTTWVNQDLSTHGIRGTREPIGGTQPEGGGTFTIPRTDAPGPIVLRGLPEPGPHPRKRLLPAAGDRRPTLPRVAARPERGNTMSATTATTAGLTDQIRGLLAQAGPETVPCRMLAWWGDTDLPAGDENAPALTQAEWEATYRLLENAAPRRRGGQAARIGAGRNARLPAGRAAADRDRELPRRRAAARGGALGPQRGGQRKRRALPAGEPGRRHRGAARLRGQRPPARSMGTADSGVPRVAT